MSEVLRRVVPVAALTLVVGVLLGLVAAGTSSRGADTLARPHRADEPHPLMITAAPPVSAPTAATSAAGLVDFASAAAALNATVVNVDAAASEPEAGTAWARDGADAGAREGSGSGFIIDPAGYILTNEHVVEGADRVTVTLSDGRALRASIVGVDPAIDVALLKISAAAPLPAAPIGRSEDLRVGEWVCAIGNPLGYVHSVTVGVVSFLGRKLFDQSLDAFIQTDAAISFGNSGGPLIDARGEVVGITAAVSAQASNIGFAIPISQVMAILPQLRERGRVARGYLGVSLTNVTPGLSRALALGRDHGALIQDVTPDTPAERAGLRAYDVIASIDGRDVRSDDELIRYVSALAPGTIARLTVMRAGVTSDVALKLTERPSPPVARAAASVMPARRGESPLGLSVHDLDAALARRAGLPDDLTGVLIADVDPAGPAREAHLRKGQVLLEIDRRPVRSATEFQSASAHLRAGDTVALLVFDPLIGQRAIYSVTVDPLE